MTSDLLNQVGEWSHGRLTDEELQSVFQKGQADIAMHYEGFSDAVEALDDDQDKHCGDLIDFIFNMMESVSESLDRAGAALDEKRRNQVLSEADRIARACFQLNQGILEFRNQSLLKKGPTTIPALNLLYSLYELWKNEGDESSEQNLLEALESEGKVAERLRVQTGQTGCEDPRMTTLERALGDHMKSLESMARAVTEAKEADDLLPHLLQLQITYQEIQTLLPVVNQSLQTEKPTPYPMLNRLLYLMRQVGLGESGEEPLVEQLESVETTFSELLGQIMAQKGTLAGALAEEELEKLPEALDTLADAVEYCYDFLEDRDPRLLEKAKAQFLLFARELSSRQQRLQSLLTPKSENCCALCGRENQRGSLRCPCGAPLNVRSVTEEPLSSYSLLSSPQPESRRLVVTEGLAGIYRAADRLAAEQGDGAELLSELEKLETRLKAKKKSLSKPANEADHEKLRSIKQGVDALSAGIELMRRFAISQEQNDLRRGVLSLDRGARVLTG